MREVIHQRLQTFNQPGSMGIVTDTRYTRCFWPSLAKPTALFADGSRGIEVLGSARNVIFPPGTVFLDYYPDALYPAEQAVMKLSPRRAGLVNLTAEEAAVWRSAYDAAVASFPDTHAIHTTRIDCHFLRHEELVSPVGKKPIFESYVAELSSSQVDDFITGRTSEDALKTAAVFVKSGDALGDPATKYFKIVNDKVVDVTADLAHAPEALVVGVHF